MSNSRRKFLMGSAGLVALNSMPLSLQAKTQLEAINLNHGLVFYRVNESNSYSYAETMVVAGMQKIALAEDPVRQWRDQVQALITQTKMPVLGLTDWADYQLMRGLNGELRRYPLVLQEHKFKQGEQRSLFSWVIG